MPRAQIALSVAIGSLFLALALVLAGCGGDDGESSSDPAVASGADFDRAFIDAMVPHHESAIEMANDALKAGLVQDDLVEVANNIVNSQEQEITQMKQWREEWFGSAEIDPQGASALGMSDDEMGMGAGDMSLEDAPDPDAAFAQMMIAHHEGAIAMAKLAEERAERDEIKQLAEEIIAAQEAEIEIMQPHAGGMGGMDHG